MLHAVEKRRLVPPQSDSFGIPSGVPFKAYTKKIKHAHKLQITLDYEFEPGLWVKLGFNGTLYAVGYFVSQPNKENT